MRWGQESVCEGRIHENKKCISKVLRSEIKYWTELNSFTDRQTAETARGQHQYCQFYTESKPSLRKGSDQG